MTLNEVIGADDQVVVLLSNAGWIGSFPAMYIPTVYHNCKVTSIMPDVFDGNWFESGVVLKVWIDVYDD